MSALPAAHHPLAVAEYLEGERHTDLRHEFGNGEITAMAGATEEFYPESAP